MEYLSNLIVFVFIGLNGIGVLEAGYLEEVCMQPKDEGRSCSADETPLAENPTQFYFNPTAEKCESFQFKGCGGNRNRFNVQDDCTDACQVEWFQEKNKNRSRHESDEQDGNVTEEDCQQEPETGPCRALIVQWYYDSKTDSCRKFNYGGCQGNKNRFNSEAQCEQVCGQ